MKAMPLLRRSIEAEYDSSTAAMRHSFKKLSNGYISNSLREVGRFMKLNIEGMTQILSLKFGMVDARFVTCRMVVIGLRT